MVTTLKTLLPPLLTRDSAVDRAHETHCSLVSASSSMMSFQAWMFEQDPRASSWRRRSQPKAGQALLAVELAVETRQPTRRDGWPKPSIGALAAKLRRRLISYVRQKRTRTLGQAHATVSCWGVAISFPYASFFFFPCLVLLLLHSIDHSSLVRSYPPCPLYTFDLRFYIRLSLASRRLATVPSPAYCTATRDAIDVSRNTTFN
jgi:hypothetical protein